MWAAPIKLGASLFPQGSRKMDPDVAAAAMRRARKGWIQIHGVHTCLLGGDPIEGKS
jgi:hypothetical protein